MQPIVATARIAFALLCLIVDPALPAQSAKAAQRELRAAVNDLDEKSETGARAVAAIQKLGAIDTAASAAALLDTAATLAKRGTEIADDRRRALLDEGGSGRLKRSRYELRNVDDAAEAIARVLDAQRTPEAIRTMLKRMTDRGNSLPLWLRLRLAARAGEVPTEQLDWRPGAKRVNDDTLLALLSATAALGPRIAENNARTWLLAQLEHKNKDVRTAAVRGLGKLLWAPAIELLIARIDAEQGASREVVFDTLVVLTGADPGDSTASWRAWFAAEGSPLMRGERPLGRGDATVRKREASGQTVSGSYFGIAQTGKSILYVFDNSLSMQAKLRAGNNGPGPITGDVPETRWQLCRRELRSALRGLSPDKKFNAVSFANKARSFEQTMQPATPENIARAIEWIDALQLEFQTNVFDALELAFVLAGRGTDDRYYPTDVDTMFFLSDGAPTIPNLTSRGIGTDDSDRILSAVQRWNALGRITVHTIGIGLQPRRRDRDDKGRLFPPVFLRLMAEQNGGQYTARR